MSLTLDTSHPSMILLNFNAHNKHIMHGSKLGHIPSADALTGLLCKRKNVRYVHNLGHVPLANTTIEILFRCKQRTHIGHTGHVPLRYRSVLSIEYILESSMDVVIREHTLFAFGGNDENRHTCRRKYTIPRSVYL